jgi:hypothetical protein
MISHDEFVEGYHAKRIDLTVDAPSAYLYAATRRLGWEWMFTGALNLFLGEYFLSILFLILTFYLHDGWLLVGVPAAFVGIAAGSPNHSRDTRHVAQIFIAAAFVGLILGCFVFNWQSPIFLVSCVFFVGFAKNVIYHTICRRAFLRLLLTRKNVFEDAIKGNLIALKENGNPSIVQQN